MNRKLILSIIILSISVISIYLFKTYASNFGYIKNGADITFTNNKEQVKAYKLNDNEILFLGKNTDTTNNISVPTEIYNIENNTIKLLNFPNILYQSNGILINKDKLLLLNASKQPSKVNKSFFNTIVLIDLTNNKEVQFYDKKINRTHNSNIEQISYTLLNNGNVLIIDFKNKIAEVYNPNLNTSITLNFAFDKNRKNVILPFNKDQALIFGQTNNNYDFMDTVIIYDDKNKTFQEFGHTIRRTNPYIIPLKNNEFLIIGGTIHMSHNAQIYDIRDIEIFDANTGLSKIVNKLPKSLKYDYRTDRNSFAIARINDRYILITGGKYGVAPFEKYWKNSFIIDTEDKYTIKKGPNLKYPLASHQMLQLKTGKILIYDGDVPNKIRTQMYYLKFGGK